jgi:prepilin-type N-terminal cleavage/methylation domain-containing protein
MAGVFRTSRTHGFTLLELLVVLVLISLVTGSIVPSISAVSDRAVKDQLIADLINLDARARLLAETHASSTIRYDPSSGRLQLIVRNPKESLIQEVHVPESVLFGFEQPLGEHYFDRFGRTVDYAYIVRIDQSHTSIRFNGLTGWHKQIEGTGR